MSQSAIWETGVSQGSGGLAEMEIDTETIRSNYREIERRVGPGTRVMPSLKADAYGYGALEVAKITARLGAFGLFTGNIGEAIAMRQAGLGLPIVIFGAYLPDEMPRLLAHDLIPTVYNLELARAVGSAAQQPREVYIKVDCGLGRLGVPLEDAVELIQAVARLDRVIVGGLYTHLPFGDAAGCDWARRQLGLFDALLRRLADAGIRPPVTQARASSGVAAGLGDAANAVCVGHLLYGLSPFSDDKAFDLGGFRPALRRIRSRLIHVGRHGQGSDLAIGGLYGVRQGKVMGVLPVGLSSGLGTLKQPGTATALVRGRAVPVVSISLEHTTLDLGDAADCVPGDEVVLVDEAGESGALRRFAAAQGRTPLEAMANMSARWQRSYADSAHDIWATFNQSS